MKSPLQELAALPPDVAAQWLGEQEDWVLQDIARGEWWWTARPEQRHPPGDWYVWLIRSGRGFGKTRTGAEWIVDRAISLPMDLAGNPTEWLVIAETMTDALRQCYGGPAGIKRVLERRLGPMDDSRKGRPSTWRMTKSPKPAIELAQGQMIFLESADDEDVGRGYNAAGGWLDEFAKWPKPDGAWAEGIMPSLRADLPGGEFPRVIVTTTPKLIIQLAEWEDRRDGTVHLTGGSTYENAANLAAPALAELHRRYSGTRLGRQELHGILLREMEGALWTLETIERNRHRGEVPEMSNVVVGMDAAGTGTRDETGLVAVGRGVDEISYVVGDWSKRVVGRAAAWRAWEMVKTFGASLLIYEDNQGKAWLGQVLSDVYKEMQKEGHFPPGGAPPMKSVTAKVGKRLRAEPVAARYEQDRMKHAAKLGDLETQQVGWVPEKAGDSPDRIDALVYAELHLASRERFGQTAIASPVRAPFGVTGLSPLAGR
ncbi:MAG: terminase family protein [Rhizobacter sp.]